MRRLYAGRRKALLSELASLQEIKVQGEPSGLHLVARLVNQTHNDVAFAALAGQEGLPLVPLSPFWYDQCHAQRGLVLGFASSDVRHLKTETAKLRGLLRRYAPL